MSMTRRLVALVALVSLPILATAQTDTKRLEQATMGLIPYPNAVQVGAKSLHLGREVSVYCDAQAFDFPAQNLARLLSKSFPSLRVNTRKNPTKATIQLRYNPKVVGSEAYKLSIKPEGIVLEASELRGAMWATMSLVQILESHYNRRLQTFDALEELAIVDRPRYEMRALMLDPARHFLPLEAVKAYMDTMLRYKYNTLQLHLSDDQGWRVEIKKHPRLTELTSQRSTGKPQGRGQSEKRQTAENGYYTQDELRELVAYARERGIEIIPEIDVPGHTAALLAAYPHLRMESQRDSTFVLGKVDNVMLSAVEEGTYNLLDDIMAELSQIFPRATRLHLGGDESAIARNWAQSESHIRLARKLGYEQVEGLMNYFFSRVYRSVDKYGFRPMQWCELDNIRLPASKYLMDYPTNVALVSWRMGLSPKCIELTRQTGHKLVLAPGESAYLDYPQWSNDLPEYNNWGMPTTTLWQSYNFDLKSGISAQDDQHILGVMATLWGEAIQYIDRAYYMTYPRALALAEVGWTEHKLRHWERFARSVPYALTSLERSGVTHRRPVELFAE